VVAAGVGVLVFFAPILMLQAARRKLAQRFEELLPEAINVLVSSVRAGNSLATAIEEVGRKVPPPVGPQFTKIVTEHQRGINLEGALARARERLPVESFGMITTALIINSEHGGDLMQMIERMSDAIRSLEQLRKKIYTETMEVRAQSKLILWGAPAAIFVICMFSPSIPQLLFHSVKGSILLIIVVTLMLSGMLGIRQIVERTI
jgi:tight adherence protein B